jgi:hypothetical protein
MAFIPTLILLGSKTMIWEGEQPRQISFDSIERCKRFDHIDLRVTGIPDARVTGNTAFNLLKKMLVKGVKK